MNSQDAALIHTMGRALLDGMRGADLSAEIMVLTLVSALGAAIKDAEQITDKAGLLAGVRQALDDIERGIHDGGSSKH